MFILLGLCMYEVCSENLSDGSYTRGKEAEIGEGPGNRPVITKTGSRILPELHDCQIICRLVKS